MRKFAMLSLVLAVCLLVGCVQTAPVTTPGAAPAAAAPEGPVTKTFEEVIGSARKAVTFDSTLDFSKIKVGVIHAHDPSDKGTAYSHNLGAERMLEILGMAKEQLVSKFNIAEDDSVCITACEELIEDGCNLIFGCSFGFESGMLQVAAQHPEVEFCHWSGYQADGSGLPNFHNYFSRIFETRYLSGIIAGLKAKELNNPLLGYVAAFPFAEVVSGYSAFYLGAKSVYPEATMKVMYTGSWNDPTKEAQNAQALLDAGCGVLGQHGAGTSPATVCEQAGAFEVGYNNSMIEVAPKACMTSAICDWSQYMVYAVNCVASGTPIATDWAGGLAEGVTLLSDINESIVAPGTDEAVKAAYDAIIAGTCHVFDGPLTDVDGNEIVAAGDFFAESAEASSPSWDHILQGIEVVE